VKESGLLMVFSKLRVYLSFGLVLIFGLTCLSLRVMAQSSPTFHVSGSFVNTLIYGGLQQPTALRFAPDGRLFVISQYGKIDVFAPGATTPTTFLEGLPGLQGVRERGLLGIAFPPNFQSDPTNRYMYLYYTTDQGGIHNRISRFPAGGSTAGAEEILVNLETVTNDYHNGGAMDFREADGKLYVAVGENGVAQNAQSLNTTFGKILRFNPNGTIPNDNPFPQATGNNRAIWALGLRNPYNFDFNPVNNRMFINDVGEVTYEEINDGIRGANYGWPLTGDGEFNQQQFPNFTNPLHVYSHDSGNCAIVGAAFYVPDAPMFPSSYNGDYFFADYCSNRMWFYDVSTDNATLFMSNLNNNPVGIEVGPDGALYYITHNVYNNNDDGQLHKVTFNNTGAPQITDQPDSITRADGESTSFSCSASGNTPLTFTWQRRVNGVFTDIAGTTSSSSTSPATRSYTLAAASFANDNGAQFRCVVTNPVNTAQSQAATLTVQANQRPTATILSPAQNATFRAGDAINYSGTGIDPEQGTLPASSMRWRIDLHHDAHIHPYLNWINGVSGGVFTIPTTGHPEHNVYFRFYLEVSDSGGLTHQVYRDIYPQTVSYSLRTQPSGVKIDLDGQPRSTPYNSRSIINMQRDLSAPLTQVYNGAIYVFQYWADSGAPADRGYVTTPGTDVTYTAVYAPATLQTNRFTTQTPTLTWVRIPWALGYEIQIDDDSDFGSSDPIFYIKSDLTAETVSFTLPASNPTFVAGTYYWRLRALRSDGTWGAWSTTSSFTIDLP
jgi:glucose/arabinose dehydrogenase